MKDIPTLIILAPYFIFSALAVKTLWQSGKVTMKITAGVLSIFPALMFLAQLFA